MAHLALSVVAAPAAPRFSWATTPVFYHSCNFTGPFTSAALDIMAKFPMVTIEKGQGVYDPNDKRFAEDKIIDALRGVKERNPNVSTVLYYNSILDWPFYRLHALMLQHPELWARDAKGAVCRSDGDGSFPNHTNMLSFDFRQQAARDLWAAACLNATRTGFVDGCFSDRSDGVPACKLADPSAFREGHLAVHQELQAALGAGPLIANNALLPGVNATMIEGFVANEASILQLQRAAASGRLVQAHAGYGEDGTADEHCSKGVTNSLAAFLIGAGERSYYGCSHGWKVQADPIEDAWRPEYDRPLGTPSGLAEKNGTHYRRIFYSKHGKTVVTFDVTKNVGTIRWAAGAAARAAEHVDTES